MPELHLDPSPLKKTRIRKRSFLAKLGTTTLGVLAGVAGIVAYPIASTVSEAAIKARIGYYSSRFKLIKGTWGFARGAVTGFGRGILKGIAAPFVLPYFGWKGKLSDKLRNERDKVINAVRGPSRSELMQTDKDELDNPRNPNLDPDLAEFNHTLRPPDHYELTFNIPSTRHNKPLARKPSVLHHFPGTTTTTNSDLTTAPITITLTSNYAIHPPLSEADIAKINARLTPSENGTFSVQNNFASFNGPNPAAALAACRNLAAFSTLQGGYALTFGNNIKEARAYLRTCNGMGIQITDCTIGEKPYDVNSPDMLVPRTPKLTPSSQ
ncbi:MAG: hypothetical protein KBD03_00375 [Gammaproteobacteria bacterium]|nr:hypothetical protein [Gammaproteobacteria bacterium]